MFNTHVCNEYIFVNLYQILLRGKCTQYLIANIIKKTNTNVDDRMT